MKYFLSLSLVIFASGAFAQSSDLDSIFEKNSYFLSENHTGKGMKFLIEKGTKADYFLIGEDHGIAEVAEISEAIFKKLNKKKYNHLVIETGLFSSSLLVDLLKLEDDEKANSFFKTHPYSIPFYGAKEEFKFLRTVTKLSNSTNPIIGIDQEFIISPRALLSKNKDEFKDEIATEIETAREGYEILVAKKSPMNLWLTQQTPEKWEALSKIATSKKGTHIINELKESKAIYDLNFQNKSQQSNELRVEKFIELFEMQTSGLEKSKIMIKMGASHIMKGTSFYGVKDLGDYLSKKNPGKTFHLGLLPADGFQNMYIPFRDESAKRTKVSSNFMKGLIELAKGVIPEEGYIVIDITNLKKDLGSQLANLDPDINKIFEGFDAILLIPQATPNTTIE